MYSYFQGDNQNDCWIFALAVLLSSIFVYNSMGTINQQALDQLQYPLCGATLPSYTNSVTLDLAECNIKDKNNSYVCSYRVHTNVRNKANEGFA